MAEGIFIDLTVKAGLESAFVIDSAGTSGHHQGELADRRMRETALQHGIQLVSRARPFRQQDFQEFDYIAAMDRSVLRDIQAKQRPGTAVNAKVFLMRDDDPAKDSHDVPDFDIPARRRRLGSPRRYPDRGYRRRVPNSFPGNLASQSRHLRR